MSNIRVKIETIRRLEAITGTHMMRGGDLTINDALDILEKKIQIMKSDLAVALKNKKRDET